MWSFVAGFFSIPCIMVFMGLYFWLTYNAEGDGYFIRGMIVCAGLILFLLAILVSIIKVK